MVLFDVLVLLTSLCAVLVCLRRIGRSESERLELLSDLTALRELARPDEEQEALAAVGLLAAEICDMVVSPVTVILGQCELARAHEGADRRFASIETQARRIAEVIDRHRGLAESNRAEVKDVAPATCARDALAAVARRASQRGVTIHEMFDDVPHIRANPFLLTHALRCLLETAVDAAPAEFGDVTFALGLLPGSEGEAIHLAFAVADDGPGIEPLQIPRIFHPYPERGALQKSAGFGYSVAYAIARATGANLVIDTAPGSGTRATFKLPVSVPAPASGAASRRAAALPQKA